MKKIITIFVISLSSAFSAPVITLASEANSSSDSPSKATNWNFLEFNYLEVNSFQGFGVRTSKAFGASFFGELAYYKYRSKNFGSDGYERSLAGLGYKKPISAKVDLYGQISAVTVHASKGYSIIDANQNYTDLSVGLKGRTSKLAYKIALISSQSNSTNGSNDTAAAAELYYVPNGSFSYGLEYESYPGETIKIISARYHF